MGNDEYRRRSKDDRDRRDSRDEKKGHDERRRSSGRNDRRHSVERHRRRSSDNRRYNSSDEGADEKEYFGQHIDFFRRLPVMAAYDAEYRRDSQNQRKLSNPNDNNHKRASEDRRDSQNERDRRYSEQSDRRNSRNDDEHRRYSEQSDRRNSRNDDEHRRYSEQSDRRHSHYDDEHRFSIPRELLEFQQKVQKTQENGPDHSQFHQRWMFLWPFGKKGSADKTTTNNPTTADPVNTKAASTNKNAISNGNQQEGFKQQNEEQYKKVYETDGVQTIDGSLTAPLSTIPKPKAKMISDNIQTSFPNFGLLPSNNIRKTNDIISKNGTGVADSSGKPASLRDHEVQTIETKIKQSAHTIQTSFANFFDSENKKKDMKDSMTSMNFKNGRVMAPRKRMGRTVNAAPRSPKRSEHAVQDNNEQPETEVIESENPQSPVVSQVSVLSPQPSQTRRSQSKSSLCPICKRGYYVTQISLSGCLAAVLCFLCCGPCWCRRCCDVTVCDYCGCSKSFYKHGKDGK